MNITKGAHNLHLGFQGWRQRLDTFYSGNNGRAGTFTFDGRYSAGPNPLANDRAGSGIAEADFLMGLPSEIGGGVNGGTWGHRGNIFATFFQDDWHIRPNLTLNRGLRWELHTPWVEVKDRQTNFGLISGAVEFPGQNGNSNALYNTYNGITNFQPRVGLAWNVKKDTGGSGRLHSLLLPGGHGHESPLDDQSSVRPRNGCQLHVTIAAQFHAESRLPAARSQSGGSICRRPDPPLGSECSSGGFQSVEPHDPEAVRQ